MPSCPLPGGGENGVPAWTRGEIVLANGTCVATMREEKEVAAGRLPRGKRPGPKDAPRRFPQGASSGQGGKKIMLHPQLETFFQVVESKSFARAAALRSCSAVTIMNQINALEERLGMRLLARSTQGVALTRAGESLYRDAKKIKTAAEQARRKAKKISLSASSTIRIGTSFLRPCKPLLDHLKQAGDAWRAAFQIEIIPFSDAPEDFSRLQQKLGTETDCFVSPCDSIRWMAEFTIVRLGTCGCHVSLPAGHPLAARKSLAWADLYGETLMLPKKGISPTLDLLLEDIAKNHPAIAILDTPDYYDVEVFNKCWQEGYLMETPEIWAGIHPSVVTLPVEWQYALPYGIICAKNPSPELEAFLRVIQTAVAGRVSQRGGGNSTPAHPSTS